MSNSKVIIIERPERSKHVIHEEKDKNTCGMVQADIILSRLRKAKESATDSSLIIVDMRETRLYQSCHILTARSANCYTKTMAKRAIQSWDIWFTETCGCPAPYKDSPVSFISQLSLIKPAIVVYDQRGDLVSTSTLKDKKVRAELHFISALLTRGNRVYMIDGGFEAFRNLRDSCDFVDRHTPLFINYIHTDDSSCSEAASPASLSDTSENSSIVSRVFNDNAVITLRDNDDDNNRNNDNIVNYNESLSNDISSFKLDNFESNETEKIISCLNNYSRDETLVVRIKQTPLRINQIQQNNEDVLSACISQILPFLYLGNARDSQDVDLIRRLNVTHIINVSDSLPMPFRRLNRIQYLHIPASDTTKQNLLPSFDRAVQFIEKARKRNGVVLVHCFAGVSRSVAVVIAYLLYNNRGLNVYKALEYVQARRSVAGPNLHFMGQLQAYYHDLHNRKPTIFSEKFNIKSKDKLTKRNSAENLTGKLKRNNLPRSVSLSSNWIESQSCTASVFRKVSCSSNTSTPPYVASPLGIYDSSVIKSTINKKSFHSTWSVSTTSKNHRRSLFRNCSNESKTPSLKSVKALK
ncbi:Dual specificity protein phosphatase 10 [Schistosoma japonicum]|nr:Dual specificity protein phosphatase 10 [Schistosoma japonicum]